MTFVHKVTDSITQAWHNSTYPDVVSDDELAAMTPKDLHDRGLCNKARLHYECHGRDNFAECG